MRLLRRLPALAAVALALYLWRGGLGLLPVERELTWRLWGDVATIRRVDVQLYQGDALLSRSEFDTPGGATFEPSTRVSLKAGTYRALTLVYRADAGAPEARERTLQVDQGTGALVVP